VTTPSSSVTWDWAIDLMSANAVGIGILGFGGFAMFAAQQFAQVPGVALRCIAETHRAASLACAARFGLADVQRAEVMFARPDVQLVYIATPPFLHYAQAREALGAAKHVIVEKPLAVTMEHADELVSMACDKGLLLVTNLMQRYNPLFGQIKSLVDSKLLGSVLRGTFENYASDEGLGPDHWFWDRDKSGGIFIEHGVHFFDMFAGGSGAAASNRRGEYCVLDRGSRSRSTAPRATATCP
jgi:predicted dehydrogenase